jgi:hypothetical protein
MGLTSSTTTTAWALATNWSTGGACVSTDSAFLQNTAVNIAAFDASAVTLARFFQDQSYTGLVGGVGTYLKIGATVFDLGEPSIGAGNGSRRVNVFAANSGAIINIYGSGSQAYDSGSTPVRLLGTNLDMNVSGGTTGVAVDPSETASVATLTMTSGNGAPSVIFGIGVTLAAGTILAGTLTTYTANVTAELTVAGNATLVHQGTGAYTALTVGSNATVRYPGTGTITAMDLSGTLDLSGGEATVTITTLRLYNGAKIKDPAGRLVLTNPALLVNCNLTDVTIDFGYGRHIQVS